MAREKASPQELDRLRRTFIQADKDLKWDDEPGHMMPPHRGTNEDPSNINQDPDVQSLLVKRTSPLKQYVIVTDKSGNKMLSEKDHIEHVTEVNQRREARMKAYREKLQSEMKKETEQGDEE